MPRPRRTAVGAKSTTASLTPVQRLAIEELQVKRQKEGKPKPLLNEVILEALELLFHKEGWSQADVEKLFPKREPVASKVKVIPRRRRQGL